MKRRINRENYEEWMLDFIEGSLSAVDEAEVRNFLDRNPDLKTELEEFESATLVPEDVVLNDKVTLKKDSSEQTGLNRNEYLFIKKTENGLTVEEQQEYDVLLMTNPDAQKEQHLFDKTVLKADTNVYFSQKNRIKRVTLIPFLSKENFNRVAAVAILILIFSVSWFVFRPGTYQAEKNIAEVQEPATASDKTSIVPEQGSPVEKVMVADVAKVGESGSASTKGEQNKRAKQSRKPVSVSAKKDIPALAAVTGKGLNDILKPVKLNGYEVALDHIMPLYISSLQNREERPEYVPAMMNDKNSSDNDLLAGGVKVINKLTGNFFNIHKRYDDKGEVVAYSFATSNLRIDHKVKNVE